MIRYIHIYKNKYLDRIPFSSKHPEVYNIVFKEDIDIYEMTTISKNTTKQLKRKIIMKELKAQMEILKKSFNDVIKSVDNLKIFFNKEFEKIEEKLKNEQETTNKNSNGKKDEEDG